MQEDARLPLEDIGESVGLAKKPCRRRVVNLEHSGVTSDVSRFSMPKG
ncbi:AsnC family transcriptional regulator [Rhizobium sp. S152]